MSGNAGQTIGPMRTEDIDPDEPFDEEMDKKRLGDPEFTDRQYASLIFIVVTYITVIPNRVFIASIATTLKEDDDVEFSNSTFGLLAILAGLAYAFGKLFDGLLIDGRYCFAFMNEIRSCFLFMIVSCVCVFMFSFGDGIVWFAMWAIINSVVQAGIWPALAKLIFEIYEPAQFGRVFAYMGIGSKIGSTFSKIYIGTLMVYLDNDWRWAVRLVSGFGCLGLFVFGGFIFMRLKESDYVWFAFPFYPSLKKSWHIRAFDSIITLFRENKNEDDNELQKKAVKANITNKQLKCKNAKCYQEITDEKEKKEIEELKQEVLREISEDIETETVGQKYGRILCNARFLLISCAVMCLTVLVGVEGFSDLLIDDVLHVSNNGYVTITSAFLPGGIATALILVVVFQYQPSRKASARLVRTLLSILIIVCVLILAWIWWALSFVTTEKTTKNVAVSLMTETTESPFFLATETITKKNETSDANELVFLLIMGALLFAFGFLLAYPYYIPPQVFSLRFGGKQDAGTVNSLMDLVGFLAVAPFSYGGAILSEVDNGWGYVWLSLYIPIIIICVILYSRFLTVNIQSEKKQELLMKRIENEVDVFTKGFIKHQTMIEMQNSKDE